MEISRKEIKKEAKRVLGTKDALLKLVFAVFVIVSVYIATELCKTLVYYLIPPLPQLALALIFDAVGVFALAPAAVGAFRLASMLSSGNDAKITEIFYYYKPKEYPRALAVHAVTALPVMIFGYASSYAIELSKTILPLYMLCVYITLIGAAAILFLLYCRLYSMPAALVCGGDQPLRMCFCAALSATKKKSAKIYAFRASFALWIALSFLTVGMLFIIFTVPYMLISYFYFNAALFGQEPKAKTKTEVTFDER